MEALRSSQEGGKFEFVSENFDFLVKVKVLHISQTFLVTFGDSDAFQSRSVFAKLCWSKTGLGSI